MPPSKRPARPLASPPPLRVMTREDARQVARKRNGHSTMRVARVVTFRKHVEMTLGGFEIEDLDLLKDTHPMRWDKSDQCWLIPRWDLDNLTEDLETMDFIVRLFDGQPREN